MADRSDASTRDNAGAACPPTSGRQKHNQTDLQMLLVPANAHKKREQVKAKRAVTGAPTGAALNSPVGAATQNNTS